MCQPDYSFVTERFVPGDLDITVGAFTSRMVSPAAGWGAVCISPTSHVDRCYILNGANLQFPPADSGAAQVSIRDQFPAQGVYMVSVERPFIGRINGPLLVLPPHPLDTDDGTRWQGGFATGLFNNRFDATLELQYYCDCPPFLPTKRAPFEFLHRWENFGSTGVDIDGITIPGWGRKLIALTLSIDGITAGDLNWSFSGFGSARHNTQALFDPETNLQPLTNEAADIDQTFFFDGEFDGYTFFIDEGTALNAGVTVDLQIKAWD